MAKIKLIGIIAEDVSDIKVIKNLISRSVNSKKIGFKHVVGNGCGKIKSKTSGWAKSLHSRGCDLLLVVHDLDRKVLKQLENDLTQALSDCPIKHHYICIPVEEIEGWFLSDPASIKEALSLPKQPNIKGFPETIASPKEKLGELIFLSSNKEKRYLNTIHNEKISEIISIELLRSKCPSFEKLFTQLSQHTY